MESTSQRFAKCITTLKKNFGDGKGKPMRRAFAVIDCPASFSNDSVESPCPCHCGGSKGVFLCSKCHDRLEYDFDDHFYCSCGKGRITDFRFCCEAEIKEDSTFLECGSVTDLKSQLNAQEPYKEINILLLGATGVGKSTWINGFANYLTYASLEEASENEILALIPSSFTLTNDDFEEVKIKVGEDPNEVFTTGQSATQQPTSYTFVTGNTKIRIIDTPGIGDTRGLDQDRKNFDSIMHHISRIDSINGICLLLKPNEARLGIVFEFCIKELLTHMHRDAAKNIVFCFTNARGTFYKPGDTFASLKTLLESEEEMKSLIKLKKETVYCMDNEAFRFLAALKSGMSFDDEDKLNFSASWQKSVTETGRLMEHIAKLTPHSTENTVSLNKTRQVILQLSRPIAETTSNIQNNIRDLLDKKDELRHSDAKFSHLNDILYVPQVDLKVTLLDHPRTVCGSTKCKDTVAVKQNIHSDKEYKVHYKQICHEQCGITGVVKNTKGCIELQGCACIGEGGGTDKARCYKCGCSWYDHVHITYDTKEVQKNVIDPKVQNQLIATLDEKKKIEVIINSCEERIKQFKEEQIIITQSSATFAVFLQKNAITPYNDALIRFIDSNIAAVETQKKSPATETKLTELENMKRQYEEQIKILNNALQNPAEATTVVDLSPQGVQKLLQSLYRLPLSGGNIKLFVDTAKQAEEFSYTEKTYVPQGRSKNKKHSGASAGFISQAKNALTLVFRPLSF